MAPVTPADISIVVPVGGPARAWPRAATSLSRLDPQPREIIVVLDGPNTAHAATGAAIGATVVALDARGGPARARNRGAAAANGDVLLFVDADVEVPNDLVAAVADVFSASPEITALMGSYDAVPQAAGFLSQARNLLHHYVHQTADTVASTFWTGCGGIRRQAFLDVGSFDERFAEPSIEDIELGTRLAREGHVIRLAPALQVTHLKEWRLRDMLTTDLWQRAVPWSELILRDGRMVDDLNLKVRDRLSVVLAFVAPVALAAAGRSSRWLVAAAGATTALICLNAGFFRFLAEHRGVAFAARAIPVYWMYLLVCGVGFSIGLLRHLSRRLS